VKNEKIIEFYRERIDALSKPLASYEKIKKFRLLPVAFTLEKDEITPTLKLKRKIIEAHYQDLIEKMYDE
jgi:long-chain acyl-CoA synthetase